MIMACRNCTESSWSQIQDLWNRRWGLIHWPPGPHISVLVQFIIKHLYWQFWLWRAYVIKSYLTRYRFPVNFKGTMSSGLATIHTTFLFMDKLGKVCKACLISYQWQHITLATLTNQLFWWGLKKKTVSSLDCGLLVYYTVQSKRLKPQFSRNLLHPTSVYRQ